MASLDWKLFPPHIISCALFFEGRIASEKSQVKTSAIDGLGLSFSFCQLPFFFLHSIFLLWSFLVEQTWLRCQHKCMFVRERV